MDLNAQKEQFSRSYVQAVASIAGYAWSEPSVDEDSVDLTLAAKGYQGTIRSPKLDLQLKCNADKLPTADFSFPLKLKNYDDLRDEALMVPRILVVLIVPDNTSDWLQHSASEMILRRCAYWTSIRGAAASTNTTTVTVTMNDLKHFCPTSLLDIMKRIGSGALP